MLKTSTNMILILVVSGDVDATGGVNYESIMGKHYLGVRAGANMQFKCISSEFQHYTVF